MISNKYHPLATLHPTSLHAIPLHYLFINPPHLPSLPLSPLHFTSSPPSYPPPSLMDSDSPSFDHLFKIMLIGATGAGKTCFILRYADNKFTDKFVTTIGIDFRVKTIERGGYKIKLQVCLQDDNCTMGLCVCVCVCVC